MDLTCLNDIIKDNLSLHIDISDNSSWNLNTGLTSVSLTKWDESTSDNIELLDFGLTQFDVGRTNTLYANETFVPEDNKVTLYRVGYNNETGGTFYDTYGITGVTSGSSVGNYFELDGGYLQGFFKLQEYNYELLPPRYGEGITIETILRIDSGSSGIYYLMGARAEDKYNSYFSGETKEVISTKEILISSGLVGQSSTRTTTTLDFSGVTTSENNYLTQYVIEESIGSGFLTFEEKSTSGYTNKENSDTYDNVISFELNSDKRLSVKRIDEEGVVREEFSEYSIPNTGWTVLTTVYKPYEIITDKEELKCAPKRLGDLIFYINGREFWKLTNYEEFYFKDFQNDREKIIGVPYNISWGGGSFGLKHSWHYDQEIYPLYSGDNSTYVSNNFEVISDPINNSGTGLTGVTLTTDAVTFSDPVMEITYTGGTGNTTLNEYFIQYSSTVDLLSNRDYVFSVDIYDNNIFQNLVNGNIKLVVYGNTGFNIIEEVQYSSKKINEWITISMTGKTDDNIDLNPYNVGFLITSNSTLNNPFTLYVKNFIYGGSDIISQDIRKSNQLIEQNFDSSYLGAIQKLRIYDKWFNSQEVLHNARIESINNSGYGLSIRRGGRIINYP